jgi:hypothetical protein
LPLGAQANPGLLQERRASSAKSLCGGYWSRAERAAVYFREGWQKKL